jgi:hypothetical protein
MIKFVESETKAELDVNDMKQEVPFEAELCCDICGEPIGDNLLVTLSGSALKTLCSNKCLAQHLHNDEDAFNEVKTSVFYDESQTGYTYPAEVWDEYIIKGKNNILGFVETLPEYTYDAVCVRRPDKTEFLDSLLLGVHKDELKNFTCSKCKSIMHTRYEWDGVLYCQNCLEQEFVAQRGKIVPDLQACLDKEKATEISYKMLEDFRDSKPDPAILLLMCFWDRLLKMYDIKEVNNLSADEDKEAESETGDTE